MTDQRLITVLDWGGWVVSNVVVGAFFPIFGMALMHFLKLVFKAEDMKVSYTAPFRDGQLGFVAVGWVVAAMVEVIKWFVNHGGLDMLFYVLALCFFAFLSAIVAAAGAVSPVEPPDDRPDAFWKWVRTYPAFSASVTLCVLTLPLAAIVHGKTN